MGNLTSTIVMSIIVSCKERRDLQAVLNLAKYQQCRATCDADSDCSVSTGSAACSVLAGWDTSALRAEPLSCTVVQGQVRAYRQCQTRRHAAEPPVDPLATPVAPGPPCHP
jgi:hypothetical protein